MKWANIKKWIGNHKEELAVGGLLVGVTVLSGILWSKIVDAEAEMASFEPDFTPKTADPYVNLEPNEWDTGILHQILWSPEDSLVCVEDVTADKLGDFGKDLLDVALKEDEKVDIVMHIFYKTEDAAQELIDVEA